MKEKELKEEKNKISIEKKWWFWAIIILIIVVPVLIKVVPLLSNKKTDESDILLTKFVTIGRLSYFVSFNWNSEEETKDNIICHYYYPYENVAFMVQICQDDEADYDVLGYDEVTKAYASSLKEDSTDISYKVSTINNHKCGIVTYHKILENMDYEHISYVMFCKKELYVFTFGEKDKLSESFIKLSENVISKTKIVYETAEEKNSKLEQQIQQEMQEFKENCELYTYEQLARNPEKIKGQNVKVTGKVNYIINNGDNTEFLVDITKKGTNATYYTDRIYVTYKRKSGEDKILEDDIITIYGVAQGEKSVVAELNLLPYINAKYIEFN